MDGDSLEGPEGRRQLNELERGADLKGVLELKVDVFIGGNGKVIGNREVN